MQIGPNDVNFQIRQHLEGPILFQPIFLENLRTTTEPNTKYVVAPFSLTRKWVFSMLSPIKIKGLSHQKSVLVPTSD